MATTKSREKRLVMGAINECDKFAWMPVQAILSLGLPEGWVGGGLGGGSGRQFREVRNSVLGGPKLPPK